ncbi:steroid 17-alpha-hydroxylase/17,20 lyase-like [Oppia nitens]|uniref:steroid 17-alpha-hydroxylase/17,20 lyase-like n=1 Tax=Oppia nitens TaxID=1686743 RepID=UPI0023DA91A8|nr:steroid 17-alpha-hydroxylase/17,20 lyase-like [Oppia nitens]
MSKKYGPVFTLYMGNTPQIMITDSVIAREAFNQNNFAGRPDGFSGKIFKNDIVFADYGHHWEALRRVAHAAVLKYSTNKQVVNVAVDCVDKTVEAMLEREGPNKPIDPLNYTYLMFLNILANSVFGENYNFDDPEFRQLKYMLKDSLEELGPRMMLWEFSPIVRWIDQKYVRKYREYIENIRIFIGKKFKSHYRDYNPDIERDFCDALIAAKNDAIRDGKESADYLIDDNLLMSLMDLFFAGTDTTHFTFRWLLLVLAYYPAIQTRLRQEILAEIGDRMPSHEDRHRCHYLMSYISETLRFRNVIPMGVYHKSVTTSRIGDYTIPEGMPVFVYQGFILRDDNTNWPNADQFIAERFLDSDGHYMTTRSPAFIPFGVGRRVCLGEKLAIADLFLVLVRFLQSTQNYTICLDSHQGLDADPISAFDAIMPLKHTIILKPN